ncbi:MAG TPA: RHS repeat-associated core domain-containing protein [Candidatus Angelobacter sp.]
MNPAPHRLKLLNVANAILKLSFCRLPYNLSSLETLSCPNSLLYRPDFQLLKGRTEMRIPRSSAFAVLALAVALLISAPLTRAQSVPCAAITRNPKALDALLNSYQKDADADSGNTITIGALEAFRFNPIVIQPGDALYLEYQGEPFDLKAHLANGDVIDFDSASQARPDQWRKGIYPLDMFGRSLNQKLIQFTATAKNPVQVLLRNIRIIRAGNPVFEFAQLSSYGQSQAAMASTRKLPCKGNDEYPNVTVAYVEANRFAATSQSATPPLTLTVQQINGLVIPNAPPIQAGDNLLIEANRSDFELRLLLSDGNVITTGPHATTTATVWRGGRVKLDYPDAVNKRIVGMRVTLLHDGGDPLLFRGIKFDRQGHAILALDKHPDGQEQTAPAIEPPMSYPPDPLIPNPHMANVSLPGPTALMPHPETGFLAPKVPSFSVSPMMFQSTTTTGDPNHYKFTGKELDAETGLYNFGARHYSPALGRFISPDLSEVPLPVPYADLRDPQSLNLYSYAGNNPLRFSDPDGHDYHVCGSNGKDCADYTDAQYEKWLKDNPNVKQSPGGTLDSCSASGCQHIGTASYFNPKDQQGAAMIGIGVPNFIKAFAKQAIIAGVTGGVVNTFVSGVAEGLGVAEAGSTGLGIGSFVTGQVITRTIQTAEGPLVITATVEVQGSTIILKGVSVASTQGLGVVTTPGVAALKSVVDGVRAAAASSGFSKLVIQGVRVSGANPNRYINQVINLK